MARHGEEHVEVSPGPGGQHAGPCGPHPGDSRPHRCWRASGNIGAVLPGAWGSAGQHGAPHNSCDGLGVLAGVAGTRGPWSSGPLRGACVSLHLESFLPALCPPPPLPSCPLLVLTGLCQPSMGLTRREGVVTRRAPLGSALTAVRAPGSLEAGREALDPTWPPARPAPLWERALGSRPARPASAVLYLLFLFNLSRGPWDMCPWQSAMLLHVSRC